jgi:hypothetical protein
MTRDELAAALAEALLRHYGEDFADMPSATFEQDALAILATGIFDELLADAARLPDAERLLLDLLVPMRAEWQRGIVDNETRREGYQAMEAAERFLVDLPAAAFDEADDMCPNCVTPWKCNGPHLSEKTPAALAALREKL